MDRLMDILKRARALYPQLDDRVEEAQALARWEKAVGPQIAQHSRAIRVQAGVLWVEVDHPIWKSELHHRRKQILEILNRPEGDPKTPPSQETQGPTRAQSTKQGLTAALSPSVLPQPNPGALRERIKDLYLIESRAQDRIKTRITK